MIKIYHKRMTDKKLRELTEFQVDSLIYVTNPTEEEIISLNKTLLVNKHLIKDAMDPYEIPRIEFKKNIIYIFTRIPAHGENNKIITIPVLIAVGNTFVAIIACRKLNALDSFLKKTDSFSTVQKTKLILQIFAIINQEYSIFITEVNKKIKSIGINLENIKNKDIIQFVSFEEILSDFINSMTLINSNFKNVLSNEFFTLYEEDKNLVENLLLNSEQLISTCGINLRNIINIRKAYSTIMTNNLNQSVELLTMITVLIAIPTLITSFYGMNILLPFEESKMTALYIIFISILFAFPILFVFIKKKL